MAATALSNLANSAATVRFAPRHTQINSLSPSSLSSSLRLSAVKPIRSRGSKHCPRATIAIGDKIPDANLTHYERNVVRTVKLSDIASSRKLLLRAIPIDCATETKFNIAPLIKRAQENADKMYETGCDAIVAVAVNGPWPPQLTIQAGDTMYLLGDEKGEFLKAMGFPPDLKDKANLPFSVTMEVLGGFVVYLRYGRGYKNFVRWQ